LLYDSKLKERVVIMQYASTVKFHSNLFFESVNDSILKVSVSLGGTIIKMRRDN